MNDDEDKFVTNVEKDIKDFIDKRNETRYVHMYNDFYVDTYSIKFFLCIHNTYNNFSNIKYCIIINMDGSLYI